MTATTYTMAEIGDFTKTGLFIVRNTVNERYGKQVEHMFAGSELRLGPGSTALCPTIVRQKRGSNMVVFKTGDERCRTQSYYKGSEQYGTGKREYSALAECVITLPQVQADHGKLAADNRPGGCNEFRN